MKLNQVIAASLALIPVYAVSPSSGDLWDISQGNVVTSHSAVLASPGTPTSMFGNFGQGNLSENEYTYFADSQPPGTIHFIEWATPSPVDIYKVRLFAAGDGTTYLNQREFESFTLKAKSPGSLVYDLTLITYGATHPYTFLDPVNLWLMEADLGGVTAQEFRAEFEQFTAGYCCDGPRIVELDAFGVHVPDGGAGVVGTLLWASMLGWRRLRK